MFYALFPTAQGRPAVILRAAGSPKASDYPGYGFAEGPFDEADQAFGYARQVRPEPEPVGAGQLPEFFPKVWYVYETEDRSGYNLDAFEDRAQRDLEAACDLADAVLLDPKATQQRGTVEADSYEAALDAIRMGDMESED